MGGRRGKVVNPKGNLRVILLTTDFGTGSPYVGQMKAAIFSVNPSVSVVDLFHDLQPQNVKQTAWFLSRFAFPDPNAINVCVVDPGVGTDRKILLCKCSAGQFIGPDNGILSPFICDAASDVIALDNTEYWLSSISTTFHGRDIMAPTAAHLSLGVNWNQMGSPLSIDPVTVEFLPNRTDGCVHGEIMMIDCYGNAISNISGADLDSIPYNESTTFKC